MPWKFLPGWRSGQRPRPSAPETPESRAPSPTVFIAREPVFDAAERVAGYELLLRPSPWAPARPAENLGEEIVLLLDALGRFGLERALGDRLGFMRLGRAALMSDLVELIPGSRFVLEYPDVADTDQAFIARLADLRRRGLRLGWRPAGAAVVPLPACGADLVVYDLAARSLEQIAQTDRLLKPHNLRRLVCNVNSRAEFEACRSAGFDLYQGRLLAQAQTLAMNRLDPSRARVIEIFNLVLKQRDVGEIEDAFKHDVALCYSLLCHINSAGVGLPYKVSSIRDAVMLLGYDFLWRWLGLLIFAGVDLTAAQRLLLNTALIRGRFAELLGQARLPARECNHLFLAGMFSLLEPLIGLPLTEIMARLHLPETVSEALTRHAGPYAPYLQLVLAFEGTDAARAAALCQDLGLDLNEASRAHLAAIEWAGVIAH